VISVFNFEPGFKSAGLAKLGDEQLEWMEKDVKGLSASTPIVVFAHLPLWTVYHEWGWGTEDAPRVLAYLKRFGSVTVLNGHIHQIQQKVEGNVSSHTARSTAFPQPAPGSAPAPGPMKVPAEELHSVLGVRTLAVYDRQTHRFLTLTDPALEAGSPLSCIAFRERQPARTTPEGTGSGPSPASLRSAPSPALSVGTKPEGLCG
jgi:3',5'-cyclic AMP phosphodiesterase CpdA